MAWADAKMELALGWNSFSLERLLSWKYNFILSRTEFWSFHWNLLLAGLHFCVLFYPSFLLLASFLSLCLSSVPLLLFFFLGAFALLLSSVSLFVPFLFLSLLLLFFFFSLLSFLSSLLLFFLLALPLLLLSFFVPFLSSCFLFSSIFLLFLSSLFLFLFLSVFLLLFLFCSFSLLFLVCFFSLTFSFRFKIHTWERWRTEQS